MFGGAMIGAFFARYLAAGLGVTLLLALAGMSYQAKQASDAMAQYQAERADFAAYRAKAVTDQAAAVAQAHADDANTRNIQRKALDAEYIARVAAQADATAARSAAVSLRNRAQALATSARCEAGNSAATPSSEAASAPGDLLADMLGRIDDAAGEIGRYADQARLAGQLCQRSYEALK